MPQRSKSHRMLVVGLTGSIGMGKSTAAEILRRMGYPIYNADKAVHNVLKKGGEAVAPVAKLFPEAFKHGAIDRSLLGPAVFGQPKKLRQLERIVHPLIQKQERAFLRQARKNKARAAILEIPLLFETGAEKRCDITLCVIAPRAVQKTRVLARPDMSEERLRAIRARQMPDSEKRRKANYIIPTGRGIDVTEKYLHRLFNKLLP